MLKQNYFFVSILLGYQERNHKNQDVL